MSLNGRLKPSELTTIDGERVAIATAHAFLDMVDACQSDTGVILHITHPLGGYRDINAQTYLFNHPAGPVPIAPPGKSTHGLGTRIDIYNWSAAKAWLDAHAATFGFSHEFASEPWHYKFTPPLTPASTGTPTPLGVHIMKTWSIFRLNSNKTYWIVGDGAQTMISEAARKELEPVLDGKIVTISHEGQAAVTAHLASIAAARKA